MRWRDFRTFQNISFHKPRSINCFDVLLMSFMLISRRSLPISEGSIDPRADRLCSYFPLLELVKGSVHFIMALTATLTLLVFMSCLNLWHISSFRNISLPQRQRRTQTPGWTLTTSCRTGVLKQGSWHFSGKYWSDAPLYNTHTHTVCLSPSVLIHVNKCGLVHLKCQRSGPEMDTLSLKPSCVTLEQLCNRLSLRRLWHNLQLS